MTVDNTKGLQSVGTSEEGAKKGTEPARRHCKQGRHLQWLR